MCASPGRDIGLAGLRSGGQCCGQGCVYASLGREIGLAGLRDVVNVVGRDVCVCVCVFVLV